MLFFIIFIYTCLEMSAATTSSYVHGDIYFVDEAIPYKSLIVNSIQLNCDKTTTFQLFSHGKPGALLIEDEWLEGAQLINWMEINLPLENFKSLAIYGCAFAQGSVGIKAVCDLEEYFGLSVAASVDITGIDGDWILETNEDIATIEVDNYPYNLQCTGRSPITSGENVVLIDDIPSVLPLCVGSVSNTAYITDSDTSNFAKVDFAVCILGCDATIAVELDQTYPTNTWAGFEISAGGLLVGLDILSTIDISTYKNDILQESQQVVNTLLGISILNFRNNAEVGFVTTKEFDEVRITYTTTSSVLWSNDIFACLLHIQDNPLAPELPGGGTSEIVECAEDPVQILTANAVPPSGSYLRWYDASTSGNIVNDPTLNHIGSIDYYAASVDSIWGCESETRTKVSIEILPSPVATIAYPQTEYCPAGQAVVIQTGQTGGSYSSEPAGLIIDDQNGTVDLETSLPGTYHILYSYSDSNSCSAESSTELTIKPKSFQQTIYVDAQASGSNDGATWENAYPSLSNEYDKCYYGVDTIKMAEGVYTPNTINRNSGFTLSSDIIILGGYPMGGGNDNSRDVVNYETVLSANINNASESNDNAYHAITIMPTADCHVDGLTLRDGYANGNQPLQKQGGGILCLGKAHFSNCVVSHNFSIGEGAAIQCVGSQSKLTLTSTIIESSNSSASSIMFSAQSPTEVGANTVINQ